MKHLKDAPRNVARFIDNGSLFMLADDPSTILVRINHLDQHLTDAVVVLQDTIPALVVYTKNDAESQYPCCGNIRYIRGTELVYHIYVDYFLGDELTGSNYDI